MFRLIGIHGKARAGKDTVASHLCKHHGFIRNAFADPLKRAAQQMFMLTDAQTWEDEFKEVVIPYWGLSPRQMFQKVGTEGGRNVFGDDLWLKRWRYHYDSYGPHSNYVVPDVRFENEADYLRKLGGVIIHVYRHDTPELAGSASKHASEMGIQVHDNDLVVMNHGTKKELALTVTSVAEELGVLHG